MTEVSEIKEGIYLESYTATLGTGHTAKKQSLDNYYLARPLDNGMVEVQLLDIGFSPLPIKETVEKEIFRKRFKYTPDAGSNLKSDKEKKIDKAIAQAEAHFKRKEYYSAEYEYSKALKLDEENVRANFGAGKVYLVTGETDKARETFEKLAQIEAVFEPENKHIFNELGIELRRMKMYDQALEYYLKAISFSENDENLYFNAARAAYEKGDHKSARDFLGDALSLNPAMVEGRKLLALITRAGG